MCTGTGTGMVTCTPVRLAEEVDVPVDLPFRATVGWGAVEPTCTFVNIAAEMVQRIKDF
jgi:hypothetical protein